MISKVFFCLSLFLFLGISQSRPHKICRCLPHQSCFPDSKTWSEFNTQIDGQLLRPRPTASPCYTSSPDYDPIQCQTVKDNWGNPFWRSDQVGSSQHNLWEIYLQDACPLNVTGICSQGSVSVYAVNVTKAEHVIKALQFASKHNLRLVIKNTGHDYLGRSLGRGSLSIWTHNLKNITFHDSFLENNCPKDGAVYKSAVTVGAGVQWAELYKAQDLHGKIVIGGFSPTVGASGGFTQGGGHSIMSPTYGLNVDNVLQFEVVTPDGRYRVANRCQNKELFWALRGGGGGTYGVVLSTTHTTHDAPRSYIGVFVLVSFENTSQIVEFLSQFVKINPSLSAAKWGGFFSVRPESVRLTYMLPNGTVSDAEQIWKPLLDFANQHPGLKVEYQSITAHPSFYDYFLSTLPIIDPASGQTGLNEILASRLIPSSVVADEPDKVVEAIEKILTRKSNNGTRNAMLGLHVAGGEVSKPHDNGVNPAWRKASWHVVIQSVFEDNASEELKAYKFKDLTDANEIFRDLAPESGSYFNEADYNEPNWQKSFFGEHYEKLERIKHALDPEQLLACHHCVGSEKWNEDITCRSL